MYIEHDVYRGNDCIEKFFDYLKEYAMKIINSGNKKTKLLTKEQQELYENVQSVHSYKNEYKS